MVENIVTKPLGLVLIITAHMIFNVQSRAEVIGFLGTNITLQFTFNVSLTKSHFAVYLNTQKKAEYFKGTEGDVFLVDHKNTSVFWRITNLKANDSGKYWATVFDGIAKESSPVELIVQEEPRRSTGPPIQTVIPTIPKDSGSSSVIVILLVVSPVVLLVAVLPCLIWCLVRSRDKQQEPPPPQSSYPTVQETVEAFKNVPGSSLVYSVLDFPKRPSAVLEVNPNDTEYAAVSYLSENRRV